jgi:anti-anti-sigma regulatory factor/HAMP domain-containing protein
MSSYQAPQPASPQRKLMPRNFADHSLQTKLILAFLLLTALSVGAVAFFSNRTTSAELTAQAGNALHQEAITQAQAVGDLLARQINSLQAFGLTRFVQEQVAGMNAAYNGDSAGIQARLQELDQQWVAAAEFDPLVQSRLRNQLAIELRKYSSAFPDNVEVFVTDRYGANVAASSRTSDFLQSDEAWWQAAWNNGQGAVYIGQPAFDQSSNSFSIILAVPLRSPNDNTVIGVLRSTYQLTTLNAMIANARVGASGRAQVLLPGDTFLIQDQATTTIDPESAAQLQAASGGALALMYQGTQRFVSQAPIDTSTGDEIIAALGWRLVVHQDLAESLQPARSAIRTTVLVAFGALLVAVLLGVGIARAINAPLGQLARIAQQIAQGDLERRIQLTQRDEIGQLAQNFNTMADTLAARLAEQQQTYETLAAQHAEQQRLLSVISVLETPVLPLGRGVLLAPLVGSLDTRRAEVAGSRILAEIAARRARWVILDLTGVVLADRSVVHELLKIGQSVQLLGARAFFTGITAEMALMLAQLEIDLQGFGSVATLEAGIEAVMQGDHINHVVSGTE